MVKNASGKEGYRSFTVIDVGKHGGCKTKFNGGKYISKNPGGAAKKAFKELCRTKRIKGVCTLIVTIRETTKNSSKKVYSYKLNRRKLAKPLIMMEGSNKEYLIEYKTESKSINVPPKCLNPGQTVGRRKKRTTRKLRMSPNNVRRKFSVKSNQV